MVFVIGYNDMALMPCKESKARKLLSNGRATVIHKMPFTIKLLYKTGCATQPIELGIDTGTGNIGIGITSCKKVLHKAEVSLRSKDIVKLLTTRRIYRRSRRSRKTEYRHPKFHYQTIYKYVGLLVKRQHKIGKSTKSLWSKVSINLMSKRPEGWLPPSTQSKVNAQIKWIDKYLSILPHPSLTIEVGRFDMARMKDPTVHNELYQYGDMYDYDNINAYVFARDNYTCQCCHTKSTPQNNLKLVNHHIIYHSKGGSDRPSNRITICERCHTSQNHQPGGILYDWMVNKRKVAKTYSDATQMNIIRRRMFKAFPQATFTYGNITNPDRKKLILSKSHCNDAVAIAQQGQVTNIHDIPTVLYIKQSRKKKRSLHEGIPRKGRKTPNRAQIRNSKNTKTVGNFHLNDCVKFNNQIGWISGFSGKSAYVKGLQGTYIQEVGKAYKLISLSKLSKIGNAGNWLYQYKIA